MESDIALKIVNLNHQFYQSFARDFSETRERLQNGVKRILQRIPAKCSVMDLGCGNGNLAVQLAETHFEGTYLGVDFSLGLLDRAASENPTQFQIDFQELDLTSPDWEGVLPDTRFDVICCFATLHHIPSEEMRASVFRNIRKFIAGDGVLYLSVWQFIRSERLKKRILPWDTVGIRADQVDEGDYLLDWRRGGTGVRYVHLYSSSELRDLAELSGFEVIETFDSDGKGGDLGHYQVWEPS